MSKLFSDITQRSLKKPEPWEVWDTHMGVRVYLLCYYGNRLIVGFSEKDENSYNIFHYDKITGICVEPSDKDYNGDYLYEFIGFITID